MDNTFLACCFLLFLPWNQYSQNVGVGTVHAGGGGGAYLRAFFSVTPGAGYNLTVGDQGFGSINVSATNGGASSITIGSVTVSASGGTGAQYSSAVMGFAGHGGTVSVTPGFRNFFALQGQAGSTLKKSYFQYDATTYYQAGEGGRGGDAANTVNTGGPGATYAGITTTNTVLEQRFPGIAGYPGGGGGGTFSFGGCNSIGGSGAWGMVVIRY